MAITQKVVDDQTGEKIEYPYITARSLRIELSPTRFVWLSKQDVTAFANGKNLGDWAEENMQRILDEIQDPEVDY